MRFSPLLFIVFISVALLVTPSSYALERATEYLRTLEETNVSVGVEYDRGDFGTDQTSYYFQVPLSISYRKNDYLVELWVPFAATNAITENIIIGAPERGGGPPTTPATTTTTQETDEYGLGDVFFAATYFLPIRSRTEYSVTGVIKFGTADRDKLLGTGENDYALEGGFSTPVGKTHLFGALGYQLTGDPPGVELNDVFYGRIGDALPLRDNREVGLSLYLSEALAAGRQSFTELDIFYSAMLSRNRRVYSYIRKGFTDSSPDWGLGIRYTYRY
ncbi:MAG: hypothetical protein HKM94_06290 [Halobacteria archaeon]|nr:hypothetical protein [Halobacteria archaeon]